MRYRETFRDKSWNPSYTGEQSRRTEKVVGLPELQSQFKAKLISKTLLNIKNRNGLEIQHSGRGLLPMCMTLNLIPITTQMLTKTCFFWYCWEDKMQISSFFILIWYIKRFQTLLQVFYKYIIILSVPMVTTSLTKNKTEYTDSLLKDWDYFFHITCLSSKQDEHFWCGRHYLSKENSRHLQIPYTTCLDIFTDFPILFARVI